MVRERLFMFIMENKDGEVSEAFGSGLWKQ